MRRGRLVLECLVVLLASATAASALRIEPDPLHFQGWRASGSIDMSVADTTLSLQASVDVGKLARVTFRAHDREGDARKVIDSGFVPGEGVNIRRVCVRYDGSVEFSFKHSFWKQHIGEGQSSDLFYVTYDALEVGDMILFRGFRDTIFGSFGWHRAFVVPEPSAALLIAIGLGGIASGSRKLA